MHPVTKALTAIASTSLLSFGLSAPANAAALKPVSYKDCKALNKAYPHGVGGYRWTKNGKLVSRGTKGAKRIAPKDHVSGKTKPVTTWKIVQSVYDRNDGRKPKYFKGERDLDRDNDGISCEKK